MNPNTGADAGLAALWDFDRPDVSEERFREALADATGDRALVLRTQLARALGLRQRFADATAELDTVAAVAAGPLVRSHLALERGRVLRSGGDPAAAEPWFVAAVDLATAAGLDHLAVDALHMLAITAEGTAQLPWAERALAVAGASTDPRARRWVASVCNNLGWTMHELGRHDEALALWERALAERIEQGVAEPVRIARWTVARGLRELGRTTEALAIQRALAAEGPPDPYVDEELAILQT